MKSKAACAFDASCDTASCAFFAAFAFASCAFVAASAFFRLFFKQASSLSCKRINYGDRKPFCDFFHICLFTDCLLDSVFDSSAGNCAVLYSKGDYTLVGLRIQRTVI